MAGIDPYHCLTVGTVTDCVVRLIFISLLGHDTSPALIHCVKLAGAGSQLGRRLGYLVIYPHCSAGL